MARLHSDGVPLRIHDIVETHFGEWLDANDIHSIYETTWGTLPLDTIQHAMRRLERLRCDLGVETRETDGALELRMETRSYFGAA